MQWKKLGLVYGPDGSLRWAKSHAMIPTPLLLNKDVIRVFVTFCDEKGIGRPGYVDVSAKNPVEVLSVSQQPLLELGKPGTFDENGLLTCSVTDLGNGKMFMYYAGFEMGTKIRYRLLTGLAISEDWGETFCRYSPTPVLERTATEMYFRCGSYCIYGSQGFQLWYVAGSEWIDLDGKPMPVYDIRYAESQDGIHWPDQGEVQISITEPDEHGFGRPWVVKRGANDYQLFYSIRRRSLVAYRLGYAESTDGINWVRKDDEMGLDVTQGEFDSDAIMYSAVISVGGKTYCFYNGNNFGEQGFGVAELMA
jgi:hypothetical protein